MWISYTDVLFETSAIVNNFASSARYRRPADQVFERVARARLVKQAIARMAHQTRVTPVGYKAGTNPSWSRDFELALRQRAIETRKLHEESQGFDCVVTFG